MSVAIITGSAGLVGSEAVAFFASLGLDVVGIDNGMRAEFFRPGSIHKLGTQPPRRRRTGLPPLRNRHSRRMRDRDPLFSVWPEDRLGHPHSRATIPRWAASNPPVDFTVNANGTLVLLEATRRCAPEAVFIYMSTNKVYGDRPNELPLVELDTRWELDVAHP